jgi:hypothetical protein
VNVPVNKQNTEGPMRSEKYPTKQANKHGKYSSNIGNVTVNAFKFYHSKN